MLILTNHKLFVLIVWAVAYFFSIYFLFTSLTYFLTKTINRPIEIKPIKAKQIQHEILLSLRSIVIFGLGVSIPYYMPQYGLTTITLSSKVSTSLIECCALILWNDVHFYLLHRLLHAKFKKQHLTHHRSVTATPFSAYSMSVVEALLLGSVMPIAMLFYDFSLAALLFLPIWSIVINALAHSNCNLFKFIQHHQQHHSNYHGNYGFFFSQLDRWFKTNHERNA